MAIFLCLLMLVSSEETVLKDGKTQLVDSSISTGSELLYKFHVDSSVTEADLVISLTTYSDYSDPDMFVDVGRTPSFSHNKYSSLSWGSGSIVVPPAELSKDSDYYILVVCYTFCRYGITVSYTKEITLNDGIPIQGNLNAGRQAIYTFTPAQASSDSNIVITLSKLTGKADMYVINDETKEPTSDNTLIVDSKWDGSLEFKYNEKLEAKMFRISVMAEEELSYTLLAKSSHSEATMIQASVPISGEVETGAFNYYYLDVYSPNDTLRISLTMLTGDGDIYARCGAVPSLLQFNFSSVHLGNENLIIRPKDRKAINCSTGKYYIGIYGYLHAAYTLTVTVSESSFVQLFPGIPQSGSVGQSEFEYYYLSFPRLSTNISISVAVGSGNPDLYVKFCTTAISSCYITDEEISSQNGIYVSKHVSGSDSVDIAHLRSNCPRRTNCTYVIGVYGSAQYSTYTILLTTNSTDEIRLREGRPMSIIQQKVETKYFRYRVFSDEVTEVQFLITPIYGDPDIYSLFNQRVDANHYDKSSMNTGVEIDQITYFKGNELKSLQGTFHLMVFSMNASSYSIVAKEKIFSKNTTIQIYPGQPQKDTIYNQTDKDYRIYSFPVHYTEETKQEISITLTAISGGFSLFVANQISNLDWKNEIFYYNWKSTNQSSQNPTSSVIISPADPWYKLESTYLILVMATEFLADKSATYVISYSTGDVSTVLIEDVPHTTVVNEKSFNYYTFPVHINHEDITISVAALSGDPDIYISVDPQNPNPTQEKNDFMSASYGSETITLIWENGLKKKCPNLPDTYQFGDKTHCQLYISVYALETSTYTIRIHASRNLPSLLTLGQTSFGALNKTMYGFFYVFADAESDMRIILQSTSGSASFFVNILDKEASTSPAEMLRPSKELHHLASWSSVMTEELDIFAKAMQKACSKKSCIIMISTYCMSDACYYSITAKQEKSQMLIENQPTYGFVSKGITYYSYFCDKDYTNFLVTVTPLNDGNPDLYISRGSESKPSDLSSEWSSSGWGGDSILITKDDPILKGSSMKGTYMIGVKDNWGNSSFSIIVNNHPNPITKLANGVPQFGNITINGVAYYSFTNSIRQEVLVTLTPTSGSVKLYINTVYIYESDIYSHLPSPENYIWSSISNYDRYSFSINEADPNFCEYCLYLIAVKSDNSSASFSVTAKNGLNFKVLQNGVPTKSEVSNDKWSIFSFEMLQKSDFIISVNVYSGHPNLHVTTNKTLTPENYIWSEYYVSDVLNIKIDKESADFKLGTYYIIVSGSDTISFTIIAHSKDSAILLVDGWPIFYELSRMAIERVNMRFVGEAGSHVFCTIKGNDDFLPTVYTKFQYQFTPYIEVTSSNSAKTYNSSDYSLPYNQLSITLSHTPGQTQLNLGIFSSVNTTAGKGRFQIFCSSSAQTTILRVGTKHIEMLDKNVKERRYEMVTPSKGTLDAYVIPCVGSFKLEISSNWSVVTQESPDVVISRLTDGVLTGTIANANGRYYVSIASLDTASSEHQIYEILSQFTEAGKTAPRNFNPGKNGLITWSLENDEHALISWNPVENDAGEVKDSQAVYSIYFTSSKHTNMLTACAIHYFTSRKEVTLLGSTSELFFKTKLPKDKGFVNVLAVLPYKSVSPLKEIIYDPTEILISRAGSSGMALLIFWILATLLFLAVITSIYFYKKKKRAETVLNYEMSDVRNVASVSAPVRKNDPYSRLTSP